MIINNTPLPITTPPNVQSITPSNTNSQQYINNFSNFYLLQGQQLKEFIDSHLNSFDEKKIQETLKKITELRLNDAVALNKIHKLQKLSLAYEDLLEFSLKV